MKGEYRHWSLLLLWCQVSSPGTDRCRFRRGTARRGTACRAPTIPIFVSFVPSLCSLWLEFILQINHLDWIPAFAGMTRRVVLWCQVSSPDTDRCRFRRGTACRAPTRQTNCHSGIPLSNGRSGIHCSEYRISPASVKPGCYSDLCVLCG